MKIMPANGDIMTNLGKEDEFKEFKLSTTELEKGLISITSMLNKHCKAQVFFGVKDNGEVVGQDIGKNTLKSITQAIVNFIDPHITPIVSILDSDDGRKYISVYTEAHDRPYLFKGITYIRTGEEDRKATHGDLRKMVLSSGDLLKDTVSLNQNLKFTKLIDILKHNNKTAKENITFYNSIGLINPEGAYNKQAELLSDENQVKLTVAIFGGLDRSCLSLRKDFGNSCLLDCIRSVINYIESINERFVDVTGTIRKERDLFDFPAFKEAWINACVHNNWINDIPPTIHIFDDRMEIISYGDKPYWLSKEDFFKGQSMPVNESLMRTFISVGLSEHTGHGVPVITKTYGESAYTFSGGSIKVTLKFFRKRNASCYRDESVLRKLSENELSVLVSLKEHPDYTLDQISELTDLSRATVGKIVPALRKNGYLERIGSYRDGIWAVHADVGEVILDRYRRRLY